MIFRIRYTIPQEDDENAATATAKAEADAADDTSKRSISVFQEPCPLEQGDLDSNKR